MPDTLSARSCLAVLVLMSAVSSVAAQKKESPQAAILRLTNEFRKSNKVSPLPIGKVLADTAQKHAANMARQDKYGDDGKNGHIMDGKRMRDRLDDAGYKGLNVGENVGLTRTSQIRVIMEAWKKSAGHRKNLLNPNWTETGIGAAQGKSGKWYFCHLFGAGAEKSGES